MTRLSEIESHIATIGELRDVVGAIRSLAGMRMQEAQRALPSIRRYAETVAASVAAAMRLRSDDAAPSRAAAGLRRAVIVCTSEHGFVGGFNERLVSAASAELRHDDFLFIVGTRGAALFAAAGRPGDATWAMATRLPNTTGLADRVVRTLYDHISRGEIGRVDVIHARPSAGAASVVVSRSLLPLDPASVAAQEGGEAPVHYLSAAALLEALVGEYLFGLLAEALVESLASENAARLSAMEAARDNVTVKLEQLHDTARRVRQSDITSEVLELIAGAEATT
ncbi:MAG: FoF1 ATP synthase subunit gamma [Rhodospirillales bacterium]